MWGGNLKERAILRWRWTEVDPGKQKTTITPTNTTAQSGHAERVQLN